MKCDKIILGAGIYGLYAALRCARRGEQIVVLERDSEAFSRATTINQARVHMGYHYPRSLSTALKSAHYFNRFLADYEFCILEDFDQIYATSARFSWTNASEFKRFCHSADIRCDEVDPERYFKPGFCDGTFITTEYTYDAGILKDYFLKQLASLSNVRILYGCLPTQVIKDEGLWRIQATKGEFGAPFVLNATYAGVNNIHALIGADPFAIKYELCEIILCQVDERLRDVGLTVMDGPFFSIMPYGKTGLHSLTSVTFTPHQTSYDLQPAFECQQRSDGLCRPDSLYNCDICPAKPDSAWPFMSQLARKYLRGDLRFSYEGSLFSMKPILKASEIDDSRPTVVKVISEEPYFISVLSGKINTIYDLDEYLDLIRPISGSGA